MERNEKNKGGVQALTAKQLYERETWRTTRRENEHNYEHITTPLKWSGILSFIIDYQNKHHGLSPTDLMISKGTNLSAGTVGYHIKEMESAGLIKDNKGSPRIITIHNAVKLQIGEVHKPTVEKVTEVKTMDSAQLTKKKFSLGPTGRQPFIDRAKAIAQAIIDHYDQYGYSPKGDYIKQRVYGQGRHSSSPGGGGLPRVIRKMVELGWLHHKWKSQSYAVTGLGRAALFGQQPENESLHTDTQVSPRKGAENYPQNYDSPLVEYEPEPVATIPRRLPIMPSQKAGLARVAAEERFVAANAAGDELHITGVSDVDMIIELTRRGFKVSR